MSGAPAPWKRKLKPLPLPGDTASDATPPSAAGAAAANQPTDGDDELDKLSAMYEAEAVAKARDVASKQAASRQPSQKGMHQLRREGLAAALPEDNKGFRLLQRMGWSEGQGLGAGSAGRATPLDVELKTKRTGLGIDEDRKRRKAAAEQEQQQRATKRVKLQQLDRATFRETTAQKFSTAIAEKHVTAGRKTIETLDERGSIPRHHLWPPPPPPPAAEPDGATVAGEGQAGAEAEAEPHPWELLPAEQRLADVLEYLRGQHCYCLFCGCQYDSAADLAASCPGLNEGDH